ncbi:MAG TPA: glycosyltransferase [Acidimicrobiales bacterium]|nr:glycosyltransferase [Acidimicrobiales bacterium]
MPRPTRLTVAALVAAASSGHVLYPAWLAIASRNRPVRRPPAPSAWPAVTVVVAAYREAGLIADKVADVRANGYPGALEVLVVADGDPTTAERAERAGATVISAPERLGKAQAVNLGMSKVTTPVAVLSDANNRIAPGAIAAMVEHLADPAVGAVAGEKSEEGGGEGLYWRFESWLKQREWRLGTTVGLVGELAAVRTDAFQPIPADVAIDDLWIALDLSARGYAIAYEPRAKAVEPPAGTMAQQWERRTRSVASALYVFWRQRRQLGAGGGLVTAQIWGHRLARYTVSPLAQLVLVVIALTRLRSSRLARLFMAGHVAAAWALVQQSEPPQEQGGPPSPLPTTALAQGLFLQGVALGGIVRFLRGDRPTKWPTVER